MALDEPVFFDTDKDVIIADMQAFYEDQVGFKLSPGQAEMLLINAFAYREHVFRIQANAAAKQNLLEFAVYPMLDYLGALVGVNRLPAERAGTYITFNLVPGHGDLILPMGIRVQSIDGKVVFETLEEKTVLAAATTVTVKAESTSEGTAGNNYPIGEIGIILDPQAYVSSAGNTTITSGGADAEDDAFLRERIRLAPSSFSCAGPRGAYEYFAKSAHPDIIEVGITSPVPGQVNIYPLMEDVAIPSQEIIDAVFAIVNDDKVRPLTDTVAPEKVEFDIVVNIKLLTGAIASTAQATIFKALTDYAVERKKHLGRDAVISRISAVASVAQVYSTEVISPPEDVIVELSEVAFCNSITVNITGYSDE
jgi:phage-related baseplate assembly protein